MIIALIVGFLYFSIMLFFFIGWLKLQEHKTLSSSNFTNISVIISAKNEENNILPILQDIAEQNYPKEYFEVIIVDDYSTDNSFSVVSDFIQNHDNFTIIKNTLNGGKKNAIKLAVHKSKGDLIITTDADCRVGKNWISSINSFYNKQKPKMIISPVSYFTSEKLFSFTNLQALEFLSLQASTAGSAAINQPIMCNAANLAFEKEIYFEFENDLKNRVVSGDDMFLMLNIKKKYKSSIKFLKNKDAIVRTSAKKTIKGFYKQRIRWASKSKFYDDFFVNFTGALVFITNLLIFGFAIFSFFIPEGLKMLLILFSLKIIADFPLLLSTSIFYGNTRLMFLFLPLQIIYFFYVFSVGLLSFFVKVKWK